MTDLRQAPDQWYGGSHADYLLNLAAPITYSEATAIVEEAYRRISHCFSDRFNGPFYEAPRLPAEHDWVGPYHPGPSTAILPVKDGPWWVRERTHHTAATVAVCLAYARDREVEAAGWRGALDHTEEQKQAVREAIGWLIKHAHQAIVRRHVVWPR